eukprot:GHVN01016613.1.p2 GENE.GHVN01016613.1~~GHVN01016613.1.p2  ORF type:complete len:192 (+),score=7.74 GHVN01016613.1:388-963(+)
MVRMKHGQGERLGNPENIGWRMKGQRASSVGKAGIISCSRNGHHESRCWTANGRPLGPDISVQARAQPVMNIPKGISQWSFCRDTRNKRKTEGKREMRKVKFEEQVQASITLGHSLAIAARSMAALGTVISAGDGCAQATGTAISSSIRPSSSKGSSSLDNQSASSLVYRLCGELRVHTVGQRIFSLQPAF